MIYRTQQSQPRLLFSSLVLLTPFILSGCNQNDGVPSNSGPTPIPAGVPTQIPTAAPTRVPTAAPTRVPTTAPTRVPTIAPTRVPTTAPTRVPTAAPTRVPTAAPTRVPTAAPTQVPAEEPGQVTTPGRFRVNQSGVITKNGAELPVHCGAWFGLEGQQEPPDSEYNPGGAPLELYIGNMWWNPSGRTIQQTMTEIKAQGFNMIRLPIAPQTLDASDPQGMGWAPNGGALKNDPDVQQTNARQALEDFIKLADQNDIELIIDIHSCSNYIGWRAGRLDAKPPYVDANREGYIFTREEHSCTASGNPSSVTTVAAYDKAKWLNNLKEIAGLQAKLGVDNIMAIDIFNEPWEYTWSEWKSLAEEAYQAISSVNDDVLIMVEGIGSELKDGTLVPNGDEATNPNWGENFYSAASEPLNIPKERLVISPHTYGPSVFVQRQFLDPSQPECSGIDGDEAGDAKCNIVLNAATLEAGWNEHFGYLRDQGYAVLIGEFGGMWDWPTGASQTDRNRWAHVSPGVDGEWQTILVDYLKEKNINACYWSINPESADTGGLYGSTYDPVSNKTDWGNWTTIDNQKMQLLKRLWGQ